MEAWKQWIGGLGAVELDEVLQAVIGRYGVLYPDQEVSVLCVDRTGGRTEQIDEVIRLLEGLKRD